MSRGLSKMDIEPDGNLKRETCRYYKCSNPVEPGKCFCCQKCQTKHFQSIRYDENKERLIKEMGGCCEECGFVGERSQYVLYSDLHRQTVLSWLRSPYEELPNRVKAVSTLLCRNCYQKKRFVGKSKSSKAYMSSKIKAVDYLGGKCVYCDESDIRVLTFHHVDPGNKDYDIESRMKTSLEKKRAELDKCELVCWNCHALLSSGPRW